MAIEKTVFTANTLAARGAEIYNWLNANATDYFDEISIDDNVISCKIGDVAALKIPFDSSANKTEVHLANGAQDYSSSPPNDLSRAHDYAVKTNNGIFIHTPHTGYKANLDIMITKANDDTICFNSYDHDSHRVANFVKSSGFTAVDNLVTDQDMTTFTSIVYGVNCYTDKMLLTNFTQHKGVTCVLTDNSGAKYVYDGYVALKE